MERYIDAVIRLKVPDWEIDEVVLVEFRDGLTFRAVCKGEEDAEKKDAD